MDKLIKIIPEVGKNERILGDAPFRLAVVGGSNSGKSFLISRLLLSGKPFYNHKFSKIFWVNPTIKSSSENNPYDLIDLDDGQNEVYEEMNDETLQDIMSKLPRDKKGELKHSLMVLDDCGQLEKNEFSKKLFIRMRHSKMSCIISIQKHTFLNKPIRQSLSHLILTTRMNTAMVKDIIAEFFPTSTKEGEEIVNEAFKDDGSDERPFLFMDLQKQKIYKRFPALEEL